MADGVIKIGFEYIATDVPGHYKAYSEVPVFSGFDTELDVIGEQFSNFLRQVGYYMPNQYMLVESLTPEELEELKGHLMKYREKNKNA